MTCAYPSIQHFQLDAGERALADVALRSFVWDADQPVIPAIEQARSLWTHAMPARVLAAAIAMRSGTGPAAIVVKGLPHDSAIKTGLRSPMVAFAPKADRVSEALAVGAAAILGEPYGVQTEGDGIVENLSPTWEDLERHTGNGSRRKLGLHIENAALRRLPIGICPDGLVLVGLSKDPAGNPPTMVADARIAFDSLDAASRARLLDDVDLKVPERWRATFNEDRVSAPVVVSCEGVRDFAFAFYGDMTSSPDAAGREALARFEAALEAQAVALEVLPGTILIIDNRVAAHGRGSFEASFTPDGLPCRWLQRVFWTNHIERFEALEQSSCRVFVPGRLR